MLKKLIFILVLSVFVLKGNAQELNCTVNVLTPRIQSSDKQIYTTLQTSIYELMNNTKWTNDKYSPEERIECTIQIEVTERTSTDVFKANIQISSRRAVYGTSYNSPMLNYLDDDFGFRYVEFQAMEYNESGNNPNLISVLAYWAYTIIGYDYDSFSMLGGNPYFVKAQTIVANNTNSPEKGWRAFEGNRNRYWLSENINNPIYKPIRKLSYNYHRKGLDLMSKYKDQSIRTIAASIEALRPVNIDKPQSLLMKTLFDAKADEVVNIFSGAPNDVKSTVAKTLSDIDPTNSAKYNKIASTGF
jgi:Domain of unknown function (DUF4835)